MESHSYYTAFQRKRITNQPDSPNRWADYIMRKVSDCFAWHGPGALSFGRGGRIQDPVGLNSKTSVLVRTIKFPYPSGWPSMGKKMAPSVDSPGGSLACTIESARLSQIGEIMSGIKEVF